MVFACREGVLVSRTKAINELKSLIVVAPEELRAQLRGRSLAAQLARIEQLQTAPAAPVEHRLSVFRLQSITARVRFLSAQLAELDPQLHQLVKQHPAGPALLAETGVGPVVAAQLLISRSHHGRVRNEAAFASLAGVSPLETSSGQRSRQSPQPRRRPRPEPGTTHRRRHPDEMPPGNPLLRTPTQRRRQKPTATSAARSSGHWPGASTERSRPRSDARTSLPPLDIHRSVQRPAPPVLPQGHRPVPLATRRPPRGPGSGQQQTPRGPRLEDTSRSPRRAATLAPPSRCCNDRLSPV